MYKVLQEHLENILKVCQSVIITLISYPLLLLLNITFIPYRFIIDAILRVRIGEKYGGLMDPQDTYLYKKDISKIVISGVLILRSNKERDVFNETKRLLKKKLFDYPKFKATTGQFGGYPYLIEDTCNFDECVKQMQIPENVTFDEEYLKGIAGSLAGKPLPQNNTAFWEFWISEKTLKSTKDGFYYYPIIARVHHSVGDGTSLMAFLLHVLSEEDTENYSINLFSKLFGKSHEKKTFFENIVLHLGHMMTVTKVFIFMCFMGIGRLVQNELRPMDENALHGVVLTGEKVVAWTAEDSAKFLPLVKRMKTRLGTKFSHVLMTAITASLSNFFKRNSLSVPASMTALLATILEFPKIEKSKLIPLQNKTAAVSFRFTTHSNNSLVEALEKVSKGYEELHIGDIRVNRFFLKHIGLLTTNILNKLIEFRNTTFFMTNVPGGAQIKLLGDCVLEKVIPLSPHCGYMGVAFGIITYDDKFQLGLVVDKAFIQSQEEVQKIVDDVFYFITLLDEETRELEENY